MKTIKRAVIPNAVRDLTQARPSCVARSPAQAKVTSLFRMNLRA